MKHTDCGLCCGRGIFDHHACPQCAGDGRRREMCARCRGWGEVLSTLTPHPLLAWFGAQPKKAVVPCPDCHGRCVDLARIAS